MNTLQGGALPVRYPISCPQCASVAAAPVAAITVAGNPRALDLDLKCHVCDFQWRQQYDAEFNFAWCA
jgi:hypothetical protein